MKVQDFTVWRTEGYYSSTNITFTRFFRWSLLELNEVYGK